MGAIKELDLLENKTVRNEFLEKIEVLNKVKKLITFPDSELTTMKMVAYYYEVDYKTIQKNIERNREELESNGLAVKSYSEIKDMLNTDNMSALEIPRRGTYIFSSRAVLNMGMLLRDSPIAQQVRNELLNGFEKLSDEQKVSSIEEEELLMLNVIRAGSDTMKLALAMNELNNFHNRHKQKLNERIEEMKPKEEAFESFINADGYQNMKQASNTLGIGRNKLYEFLRDKSILTADNIPYQRYINQEYFVVKQVTINKGIYSNNKPQTFVTAKGINWISKLLNKNNFQ